jgi:hypothetical protein
MPKLSTGQIDKERLQLNKYQAPNVLVFLPSIPVIKEVSELLQCKNKDIFFEKLRSSFECSVEELHGGLQPGEK